jgi:hypothetical protein
MSSAGHAKRDRERAKAEKVQLKRARKQAESAALADAPVPAQNAPKKTSSLTWRVFTPSSTMVESRSKISRPRRKN